MKDDRGPNDLEKQIQDLKLTIQVYQSVLRDAQQQIFYWKQFRSKYESSENLLQGYKKVIIDLTNKLRRKDL